MDQNVFAALPWETQCLIVVAIAGVLIAYLRYTSRF